MRLAGRGRRDDLDLEAERREPRAQQLVDPRLVPRRVRRVDPDELLQEPDDLGLLGARRSGASDEERDGARQRDEPDPALQHGCLPESVPSPHTRHAPMASVAANLIPRSKGPYLGGTGVPVHYAHVPPVEAACRSSSPLRRAGASSGLWPSPGSSCSSRQRRRAPERSTPTPQENESDLVPARGRRVGQGARGDEELQDGERAAAVVVYKREGGLTAGPGRDPGGPREVQQGPPRARRSRCRRPTSRGRHRGADHRVSARATPRAS